MSFGIIRMEKMKMQAVRNMQSHMKREKGVCYSNPDIDYTRTIKNTEYTQGSDYVETIRQVTKDLKRKPRSNAVVMVEFIMTASPDFFDGLSPELEQQYFDQCFQWISRKYPYVVHGEIHRDEKTPHLHVGIIPITQDGRLSAKDLFTRETLRALQTEFHEQVSSQFELNRGIEKSKRRHLSTKDYKAHQEALGELQDVKQGVIALRGLKDDLEASTRGIEGKNKEVQVENEVLRKENEQLKMENQRLKQSLSFSEVLKTLTSFVTNLMQSIRKLEKADIGKSLFGFGKDVKIPAEDWEDVQNLLQAGSVKDKLLELPKQLEKAFENGKLYETAMNWAEHSKRFQERDAKAYTEILDLKRDNQELANQAAMYQKLYQDSQKQEQQLREQLKRHRTGKQSL